jgi:hypothetical protein
VIAVLAVKGEAKPHNATDLGRRKNHQTEGLYVAFDSQPEVYFFRSHLVQILGSSVIEASRP